MHLAWSFAPYGYELGQPTYSRVLQYLWGIASILPTSKCRHTQKTEETAMWIKVSPVWWFFLLHNLNGTVSHFGVTSHITYMQYRRLVFKLVYCIYLYIHLSFCLSVYLSMLTSTLSTLPCFLSPSFFTLSTTCTDTHTPKPTLIILTL